MTTIREGRNAQGLSPNLSEPSNLQNARTDSNILYLNRKEVELASADIDSVAVIGDLFKLHGSNQTIL
ncbi:MAG TPA: hypothetical protein VHV10_01415, partial [Ktedonobacteraceae bacterium]|nr:hypothetical protein [Ktedonobacteraceae bacterium]